MKTLKTAGTLTLLSIASLTIMVGCVIVPGLQTVAEHLGVPHAAGWLVTLPSLGVVVCGPLAGRFMQRWGSYKCLSLGLFLYGLLGCGGIVLHGGPMIFLDRILLGGATVMVMSAGTGLISYFFEGQKRLQMIAKQGMAIEMGGIIFLAVGGLLASVGWQFPFLLYLMAWIFGAMLLFLVPKPAKPVTPEDQTGDTGCICITRPMILIFFSATFSMILFFISVIFIPGRLHHMGLTPSDTGFFLAFISLMAVLSASQMPRFVNKLGGFGTMIFAFGAYTASHLVLFLAPNLAVMILGAILMGLGFGLSIPLVNHMTVELSPDAVRGRNLAYLSVAIFGGQFLSSFMEFLGGARVPFLAGAVIALIVALLITQRARFGVDK